MTAIYIQEIGVFKSDTPEFKAYLNAVERFQFPDGQAKSDPFIATNGQTYYISICGDQIKQILATNPRKSRQITVLVDKNEFNYQSIKSEVHNLTIDQVNNIISKILTKFSQNYKLSNNQIVKYRSKFAIFTWWQSCFNQYINQSLTVTIFRQYQPHIKITHQTQIDDRAPISELINKLNILPTAYTWQSNQIYVNFAANHLGGGVLDTGWVQEEFLTTCLDLLPFISHLSNKITNLNQQPVLIRTQALFKPNQTFYGSRTGLKFQHQLIITDPSQVIRPIEPVPIYWLSMAAVNLRKRSSDNRDILSMLNVAIKAFELAISYCLEQKLKIVINTGNWGAGAFGWDYRQSFLIQMYAMLRAILNFPAPTIIQILGYLTINFNAFDQFRQQILSSINLSEILNLNCHEFVVKLLTEFIK